MIIFNEIENINNIGKTAIALGNFDGMHLGHQKLISKAVQTARELGFKSAVFTFENHPQNVLKGETHVKNIQTPLEKAEKIKSLGIDYLFSLDFNKNIASMSPEEFVRVLIVEKFKGVEVFCGFNYHFGYKASGDLHKLIELGEKEGFKVNVLDPVYIEGTLVSSTLVRALIEQGKMEEVALYLGRSYSIEGEVVVGNRIGRTMNFPTSNILIDENMVTPSHGVYITNCYYNNIKYPSITNVGWRPTIGDGKKTVETHIFQFNKELYGKNIKVEFIKKIRDEIRFSNLETLAEQIIKDCKKAEEYHKQ